MAIFFSAQLLLCEIHRARKQLRSVIKLTHEIMANVSTLRNLVSNPLEACDALTGLVPRDRYIPGKSGKTLYVVTECCRCRFELLECCDRPLILAVRLKEPRNHSLPLHQFVHEGANRCDGIRCRLD